MVHAEEDWDRLRCVAHNEYYNREQPKDAESVPQAEMNSKITSHLDSQHARNVVLSLFFVR